MTIVNEKMAIMMMWVLILIICTWILLNSVGKQEYIRVIDHVEAAETNTEVIEGEVTAYTSSVEETDDRPLEMASGDKVYDGAVACPSRYHFGTMVRIEGKQYVCEDRMHRRFRDGNYFDIWLSDKKEALSFGRKHVKVIIYHAD